MHPNPVFHDRFDAENLAFAAERGFGVLAVPGGGAPMLAHVPFVLEGRVAELHLMRSNPIARALSGPVTARIAVSGPDGYVSPDWYGTADQVPTWNYVAVHLTGRLERLADAELPGVLERLSASFEARLAPKPAWRMEKMEPDALARMMRMVAPCRFTVEAVEGTWKLAQNKPEGARLGAAEGIEASGIGVEVAALAALMRGV